MHGCSALASQRLTADLLPNHFSEMEAEIEEVGLIKAEVEAMELGVACTNDNEIGLGALALPGPSSSPSPSTSPSTCIKSPSTKSL